MLIKTCWYTKLYFIVLVCHNLFNHIYFLKETTMTDEELIILLSSKLKKKNADGLAYCLDNNLNLIYLININFTPTEKYIDSISKFLSNNLNKSGNYHSEFLNYVEKFITNAILTSGITKFNQFFCPNIEFRKLESTVRHCLRDNQNFFNFYVNYTLSKINNLDFFPISYTKITNINQYIQLVYVFFLQYTFWGMYELMYMKEEHDETFILYNKNAYDFYMKNNQTMKTIFTSCFSNAQGYADSKIENIKKQEIRFKNFNGIPQITNVDIFSDEDFINYLYDLAFIKKEKNILDDHDFKIKYINILKSQIKECVARSENGKELLTLYKVDDSSYSLKEKELIQKSEEILDMYIRLKIGERITIYPRFITDYVAHPIYSSYKYDNKLIDNSSYIKKVIQFIDDIFNNITNAKLEYLSLKLFNLYL